LFTQLLLLLSSSRHDHQVAFRRTRIRNEKKNTFPELIQLIENQISSVELFTRYKYTDPFQRLSLSTILIECCSDAIPCSTQFEVDSYCSLMLKSTLQLVDMTLVYLFDEKNASLTHASSLSGSMAESADTTTCFKDLVAFSILFFDPNRDGYRFHLACTTCLYFLIHAVAAGLLMSSKVVIPQTNHSPYEERIRAGIPNKLYAVIEKCVSDISPLTFQSVHLPLMLMTLYVFLRKAFCWYTLFFPNTQPDTGLLHFANVLEELDFYFKLFDVDENIEKISHTPPSVSMTGHFRTDYLFPYTFIHLPTQYDRVIYKSLRKECSNCGKIPNEVSVCFICGKLCCLQGFCCTIERQGECNRHLKSVMSVNYKNRLD
jgi:Proteolysis_6 C-terminal